MSIGTYVIRFRHNYVFTFINNINNSILLITHLLSRAIIENPKIYRFFRCTRDTCVSVKIFTILTYITLCYDNILIILCEYIIRI